MNLELKDKIVLVSGGARGIGEAIAHTFAAEGAVVCILDRSSDAAARRAADLCAQGHFADSFPCEMTDEAAVRATVATILAKYGRVDCVVNNAGMNDGVGLRGSVADFRASLDKNVVHCFVLLQACLDALIASRGCVVNIGSKCATTGQGGTSGYVASKGALNALTREWALDLAPHGIRVNCVIPAEVTTPQYTSWLATRPDPEAARAAIERTIPLGRRMTTAQEIAETVVFLASRRAAHTTGQLIHVDGGYTHLDRACTSSPSA